MSEILSSKEFLEQISTAASESFKLGIVSSLFPDGKGKIKFDGEDTASEKKYPALSTYIPVVNDRVLLAMVSGTYVILGKIQH